MHALMHSFLRRVGRFASPVLPLPRPVKRGAVLALDAGLCVLTVRLAFYLRVDAELL
jgi:hypothetical protein